MAKIDGHGAIRKRTYVPIRSTMADRRTTSAEITVSVPAGQLDAVRTSLVELYQVCADALHHDAARLLRSGDSLDTVLARRAELSALDRLLEQAGWPGQTVGKRAIALAGTPPRLREVVQVALSRAAVELEEACRAYWHGGSELDELAHHLADVRARLAMLEGVEAEA
jgi:hypothetical protein